MMKKTLILLVALMVCVTTYANDEAAQSKKPTQSPKSIKEMKVKTNLDGEDRVIQQFLLPRFKDGWYFQQYRDWVIESIVYPQSCIDDGVGGRVVVVFIIGSDGTISFADAVQSPDKRLSDELVRVVKSGKWFQPAKQWNEEKKRYEPVPMRSMIPITFNLPPKEKPSNDYLKYEMMQSDFDGI